ncbi:MAG: hypothetical protein AAF802_25890 [Planctomycetota bacterium]
MTLEKRNTIDRFHHELVAAVNARVPIRLGGSGWSVTPSVHRLMQIRQSVSVIESRTPSLSLHEADDVETRRYFAAYQAFRETGSMSEVLDGLSIGRRVDRQVSRLVRTPFLYLVCLVLIAAIGLTFHSDAVQPSFEAIRADMKMMPRIDAPVRDSYANVMTIVARILSILALLGLALSIFGTRLVARCLGASAYYRCQVTSSALRILQSLVHSGVAADEAKDIASRIIPADRTIKEMIDGAVVGMGAGRQLHEMDEHYQSIARAKFAWLRAAAPALIVALLGGILVTAYCVAIFTPLVHIIQDSSLPGIVR